MVPFIGNLNLEIYKVTDSLLKRVSVGKRHLALWSCFTTKGNTHHSISEIV